MKYKILTAAWLIASLSVLSGCSACTETEKTEAVTAEITAAQMQGRDAARRFINEDWNDKSKLRERLDSVNSRKNRYADGKDPKCIAAFDTAFISTVRTVRPELAKEIEKEKNRH